MRAYACLMAMQIPPAPLWQRGVSLAALYKVGSPFKKGGQGDLPLIKHPREFLPKQT